MPVMRHRQSKTTVTSILGGHERLIMRQLCRVDSEVSDPLDSDGSPEDDASVELNTVSALSAQLLRTHYV